MNIRPPRLEAVASDLNHNPVYVTCKDYSASKTFNNYRLNSIVTFSFVHLQNNA